jgi:hypothetical protein
VALEGSIAAPRVSIPFSDIVVVVLFNVTPVTEISVALTVTVHEAVFLPSAVLTVMVAVPALWAVTNPDAETETTEVLSLLHVKL